jgi:hypothetical protein
MKDFEHIRFDVKKCMKEISELKILLGSKLELSEKKDILPFFRQRKHLSAFIGSFNPNISVCDKIAYEFDIWGDFKTDLAVGDSDSGAYCFIELEDAKKDSVFRKTGRSATEWSPRFEHGLSQLVDWFYKLEDQRATRDFRYRFGSQDITYTGILLAGRSYAISEKDQARLNWRSDKMVLNSVPILCITFDELYERLDNRLKLFRPAYELEGTANKSRK